MIPDVCVYIYTVFKLNTISDVVEFIVGIKLNGKIVQT